MNKPTEYERVNVIISRELKKKLIEYAKKNDMSMTAVLKTLIKREVARG